MKADENTGGQNMKAFMDAGDILKEFEAVQHYENANRDD